MTDKDHPTDPYASEPPESLTGPKLFAHLVGAILVEKLDPIVAQLKTIASDTTQTKEVWSEMVRQMVGVKLALEDLNRRVTQLEEKVASE